LARQLGATHAINHKDCSDVVSEIKKIAGNGARFTLETSALPGVFREAVDCLIPGGTCVLLGSARKGTDVTFEMPFLQNGRTVRGVIQGDSVPKEFIPLLVDHIIAGRFPVEKMITFYPLADINLAAAESSAGTTIKPVLRMPH
jgi:aryl-alcohol dehydrogenase